MVKKCTNNDCCKPILKQKGRMAMGNCTIHFLPAMAGDCFVLEFVNKECIIIDCGFKSTYTEYLRPLLIELRDKGCWITLLLITHIDQDHIEGAIALLEENGQANNPNVIPIYNVWFNGFFNTLLKRSEFSQRIRALSEEQKQIKENILNDLLMQVQGESQEISAKYSMSFEELCLKNGYCLNFQFLDGTVKRIDINRSQVLTRSIPIGACNLVVLSPNDKELDKLADTLNLEMIRNFGVDYAISEDSHFMKLFELFMEHEAERINREEFISATNENLENWLGTSSMAPMNAINRASIVVEIQYKDLKMLFTGDSDSALWYEYLEEKYQVIKLSHHGTAYPNRALLNHSRADVLLISTNGGRGKRHPEKETLAQAILAGNKVLYCNYDIPQQDILEKLQKKYGYYIVYDQRKIEV